MPFRKPFTGIHETTPKRFGIAWSGADAHEGGGGHIRPYGEDIFQRVMDVNWGTNGAVIVAGDYCCFCFYIRVSREGKIEEVADLGSMDFGDLGSTVSSTYGHTFGMGGNFSSGTPALCLGGHNNFGKGVIMTSNDGKRWRRAHIFEELYIGANVDVMVWDGKEFFTNAYFGDNFQPRCLHSWDGYSWDLMSGNALDHSQVGMPDGQWGYNYNTGTYFSADDLGVACLTCAGGVWAKGEGRTVEISLDDCETWIPTGIDAPYHVITVAAGPLSHFDIFRMGPGA